MSDETKLPPYPDEIKESHEIARLDVSMRLVVAIRRIHMRESQLYDSLAQIANLTAQVEELTATICRMRKANDAYLSSLDAANAELAVLRDGIGVEQYLSMKVRAEASESKLRAESCKHCGPNCIPGAAHNARAEDGVIWMPKPSSRRSHE